MATYADKLAKLFKRMKTNATKYGLKHPAGKRNPLGKMKTEILNILPEYTTASFVASAITDSQMTLTWSGVTGASAHTLVKSSEKRFKIATTSTVYTGAGLTTPVTGLTAGTSYYFKVTSSATSKTGSFSILKISTAAPLAAAATFVASAVTATTMTLTWAAVTGATGYVVERATNAGFSVGLTTVYTGAALTSPVTGLTTATTYFFRVKATATNFTSATYATISQLTA